MKKEIEDRLVPMPYDHNIMRFNVYLPGTEKPLRVQVERKKSSASKYGNGTCVGVVVNEKLFQLFDTRYDTRMSTIEGYREVFTEWVADQWEHDGQKVVQIL